MYAMNVKRLLGLGLLSIILSSCSAEITNASLYGNSYAYKKPNYVSYERPQISYRPTYQNNPQFLNLVYTQDVQKYINYFLYQDRGFIERGIEKAIYYSPIILPILKKYNLPSDFIYLPIIESGYNQYSVSSAEAAGIWQLMPQTARDYGLIVNNQIDERFDIIKSTEAAAHYLSDLYNQFGDWNKVLAAYNCGPYCVSSVFKQDPRGSFWAFKNSFPPETQQYVPRFLALLDIIKNAKYFGIKVKKQYFNYTLHIYRTNSPQELRNIALAYNVNYYLLKRLNPQIRQDLVPAGGYVYIPSFGKSIYKEASADGSIKGLIAGK
ncbi:MULTISPECIES: lytic transglycosylase domain-containing protein [unclassified Hydrogenobaculum]|uniref:lytic transglycosylase domain-containing protein n=1 Tax=unclassified Hydrogenobaculum TaxID=2622382 RepID=UPI0001C5029F|nr:MULTISPECIES: lytic transglycosylase domain-containing protein [unclassified Hydrogenobaculum]AEF18485.1 Lytic transglycosylase catalytic [Hydrogenobaculum sp. 3684]AEG45775.1 Lytic transglycosylase catalytic [Hydrogenobaculum sp. SHO]AGG14416.1 Lytic transglycosylase catalytic [Hydrogenobaculum sp. HO]AGH92721.1 soluble lytic murein transglycosylase-like protein [Hydrogenobaculum sp. SN]